jgi:hypothetical protein
MLSGCVTIPPEAPELSSELGNRIANIQDANLTFLHRFFDLKRNEVDCFVQEEWKNWGKIGHVADQVDRT